MIGLGKKWGIALAILLCFAIAFIFIKKKNDAFDKYPTGEKVNEDSLKFNSNEWKKQRAYYEDVRPYMLGDLRTNVLVPGMDSVTVKNLLGEVRVSHDIHWWEYRLGIYREIEASYLQIEFDDQGKLKQTKVVDR